MTNKEITDLKSDMKSLSKGQIEEWLQWTIQNNQEGTHAKGRLAIKALLEGHLSGL